MATRAARIAGISLTVLLALMVVALGILFVLASSDYARDWVLAKVKSELAAGPGLDLEIESVQGSLLSTLKFQELSVSHKGRPIIRVRQAELSVHLLQLLGGRLKVSPLRLKQPELTLPLKLDSAGGQSSQAPPLAVSVDDVEIVDGGIRIDDGAWGPIQEIAGINAKGGFGLDMRGMRAQLDINQARLEMPKGVLQASAKVTLRDQRLELAGLRLNSGSTDLKAQGWLSWANKLDIKLLAQGRLADYELLPFTWPGPQSPQAPLDFKLSLEGAIGQCRIVADLDLGGGRVAGKGVVNLTVPDGHVEIDFDQFDLLAWGLSAQSIQASGKAKLFSRGKPGDINQRADLDLELSRLKLLKVTAQRLKARAELETGVLRVKELAAAGDWGSLKGEGSLRLPEQDTPYEVDAKFSFKDLTMPPGLAEDIPSALSSPRLSGSLNAKGNSQNLDLALELDSSSLNDEVPVESLTAIGGLRSGAWWLSELEARGAWGEVTAQGSLDKQKVDLELELRSIDLAKLSQASNSLGLSVPEMSGVLEARGRMRGGWPSPVWELNASARDLIGFETYLQEAQVTAQGDSLDPLRGKVVLLVNELSSGEQSWEKIRLELSASRAVYDFNMQAHSYDGWNLSLSADSPAELPIFEAITLRRLRLQKLNQTAWVQNGTASLAIDPDGMALEGLRLDAGEQSISISGSWQGRQNVQADLLMDGLKIKPWLPDYALPAEAVLNASAKLSGSLDRPIMSLQGKLGGLEWAGLPPSRVEFAGNYQEQSLQIKGRAFTDGHPSLSLSASIGMELSLHPPVFDLTPQGISASAQSDNFPLALFEPLVPGLAEVSGQANMQITATGSLERPYFEGYLELDKAAFTVSPTGQRFENLELVLRLEGRRVEIQRAMVQSGGAMEFGGWFDLPREDGGRLFLNMDANKFDLSIGVWGDSQFDATLQARGTWLEPLITGKVKPTALRVQVGMGPPSALKEEVVVMKPGQKPPPMDPQPDSLKWVPEGFLGRAQVDLTADLKEGLRVSLDDGWLEAVGAMQLKKEPRGPFSYHGVIEVKRGLILLLGKRFEILKGKVDFAGRDEPNPMVDAVVFLRAGEILAQISVTGDADDPNVQISSEPPMTQADILSTIVFGKPAQSLDQGQSDQLNAQALALLGQRGVRVIGQLLSPELAPDVVTVHEEAQYGSSLEAGKYLSQDLYLRYRHNLSSEGGQNVGLEYRLTDWLSLESQIGDARDTGVDMVYNFDFD